MTLAQGFSWGHSPDISQSCSHLKARLGPEYLLLWRLTHMPRKLVLAVDRRPQLLTTLALLECSHYTAAGFPQSEWSGKNYQAEASKPFGNPEITRHHFYNIPLSYLGQSSSKWEETMQRCEYQKARTIRGVLETGCPR